MKFLKLLMFPAVIACGFILGLLSAVVLYLIPDKVKAKAMEFSKRKRKEYISRVLS